VAKREIKVRIYFSEIFDISGATLEEHGAFDISLINDLPLFVDPFLLFNSDREDFQALHKQVIEYVKFLRIESNRELLPDAQIAAWFTFPEVKQNWLGFSLRGNAGRGLGWDFARSLHANLMNVFKTFGDEVTTKGSHLEQLCLIKNGIGRDNISDFTVNLIKHYLCLYTQEFAAKYLKPAQVRRHAIPKSHFNFTTQSWATKTYDLPTWNGDFVLLTPKAMLTKDETWISRSDLINKAEDIGTALPNAVLRQQVSRYFRQNLKSDSKADEIKRVRSEAIEKFPEIIDEYIAIRESQSDEATNASNEKVAEALRLFISQIKKFVHLLNHETSFYETGWDSLAETRKRVEFLKDVIENKDGYRIFYSDGAPLARENDLQILFRLTWFATTLDVNREPNNGRGPVDFSASRGANDKALVEMKLASNSKLKQNLLKQLEIYKTANNTDKGLTVILFFSTKEKNRVTNILKDIGRHGDRSIYLIDADKSNKPSGSLA